MRFVKNYLKENLKWLLLVLACFGILCFVIGFEQVPLAQWGYAAFLCFFLYLLVVMIDFTRRYLHHKKLEKQTSEIAVTMDKLSLPRGQMETDYQELLRSLYITLQQQINELENGQVEQAEYFTMWVHQIKTPIAALRLLLAEEEDERSQEMWEELFSIEQYVEMALQFSRLSAKSTDFVIGEVSLDKVVREAIHKYARLFVRKKIKLELSPIDAQVLTDEKWLEFVIEQRKNRSKRQKSWLSKIPESVSHRRICQGFLKKAIPVITVMQISAPQESDCISAGKLCASCPMKLRLSRRLEWERRYILKYGRRGSFHFFFKSKLKFS